MNKNIHSMSCGSLVRFWRTKRKISQFDLSLQMSISARHLSFIETGKSKPSREMILKISDSLNVPLRHRNLLLIKAGFHAAFENKPLEDFKMRIIKEALNRVLEKHEPYPAMVVDFSYNVLMWNSSYQGIIESFTENKSLNKNQNAILMLFSKDGLRSSIQDFNAIALFILKRIWEEAASNQHDGLMDIFEKAQKMVNVDLPSSIETDRSLPLMTLNLQKNKNRCSLFSTIASIGTPVDVTAQELRLELFFPADAESKIFLENLK